MASRHIMRIDLTSSAKKQLGTLHNRHGMTQVAMMSRILEWFDKQNETIQLGVLGRLPSDSKTDLPKLILKRMAGK